ncbi:trafficking protein particle complex subunit 4-like [Symsagittifera roscoffensis]|uniref:trafficking protein particle complex subunit 4-like n=1 Tax=Symsagittifera roscoffensis TaxID=84072 RepID=UPI00307B8031
MGLIYRVAVINQEGQLIKSFEKNLDYPEIEKTFSYPLDIQLKLSDKGKRVVVEFGERDGVKIGHAISAINGKQTLGPRTASGQWILTFLSEPQNFPLSIRFCRPKPTSDEELTMYSLLYTMYAMSATLSPVASDSGFEQIDGDNFKVNIFQTVTGIKFIVVSDLKQQNMDVLFWKIYELYSDVLKDPLYKNNSQPIKNPLFDNALQFAIEQFERTGNVS